MTSNPTTVQNPIKKRKQKLVKHKRKNWKKTDITEIEQAIDDLRQQQRTGGIRSEKKDEELFFIDKQKIQDDNQTDEKSSQRVLRSNKKFKKLNLDNLKCYRNLKPDPNSFPAHNVRVLKQKKLNSKRTQRKTAHLNAKIARDYADFKLLEVEKKAPPYLEQVKQGYAFDSDLWGQKSEEITHTNEHFLRTTKKIMPKKPKKFDEKTSALPAIEPPHPGTSYNPTFEDHQDLLLKAHEIELEKLKKEQRITRSIDLKMTKMTAKQIDELWFNEMSVGLFNKDLVKDDSSNLTPESGLPNIIDINKQKVFEANKNKTTQKKRLELSLKLKKKEKDLEKEKRVQENEIYRLKSIKKEILQKEEEEKQLKEKREKLSLEKKLFHPKKISSCKFEEQELELKLSDEITGNLRNLKAEGNILTDRYKNLQKRNLIEPRKRAKRFKKYWTKSFEKKSVRDITV